MMNMNARILFLCTGNYYRSRFAEICFNWHAGQRGLAWSAESRALALERGSGNVGPLSSHAIEALIQHGIPVPDSPRFPIQVTDDDFAAASVIVALCEREHRPLMHERFPAWEDRVEYWQVEDVGDAVPHMAMAEVRRHVLGLCSSLEANRR